MAKKKSGVERLSDALYSRSTPPHVDPSVRTPLSAESPEAARPIMGSGMRTELPAEEMNPVETFQSMSNLSPKTMRKMMRRKREPMTILLMGSALFFIAAAAVAAYTFFGGVNTISPQNIDFDIVTPSLVDAGKEVQLQFVIGNRNAEALQSADLIIDYPDGTRDAQNPTQALTHDRLTLGDIASGKQMKETQSVLFFGQEGTPEQVHATVEYQIAGSNAIFTKETTAVFTIGSSPVSVTVNAPNEAISGQQFDMSVEVRSNAATPIQDVALQAQYPFGFSLGSADPNPDAGNMWRLGQLDPGESKTIHLTGSLTGEDNDERVFHFTTGSESDPNATQITVPILSVPQQVVVRKPFISGQLQLADQTGQTISAPIGQQISGTVTWTNNLQETVTNVSLMLSLSGNSIDPNSVQAGQGFYDSSKNAIIWTPQQDSALSAVGPGASGTYQFSFSTIAPTTRATVNPKVALNLSVTGSRQSQGSAPEQVSSAANITVALSSAVGLAAQGLHFTGPFTNSGPMPPVVGKPTTYTVVWTVKNSSNAIAGGAVSAKLPLYAEYVGAQQNGENVSYDAATRTVTWNLGDIKAGSGYSLASRTAAFQVSLTPSASQRGQSPALTGTATFTGQDRFSQTMLKTTAEPPTTTLDADSGFKYGMQTVTQ